MKIKNKNRTIYDDHYYKSQLLLKKQEFQDAIRKFKSIFSDFGCPIPDKVFAMAEFKNWRKELAKLQVLALKEYKEFPVWRDEVNKILKQFNLDESYYMFVWSHVFFGTNNYMRPLFETQRSNSTTTIKIFPYTRKEDVDNNWSLIKKSQKAQTNYKERHKSIDFEKAFKVYSDFNKVKKLSKQERLSKYNQRDVYEIVAKDNYLSTSGVKKILKQIKELLNF